jgi:hypothetical protein
VQKSKWNIKIILLFVLLLLISIIPVILIYCNNAYLLNKPNFTAYMVHSLVYDETNNSSVDSNRELSIKDKLLSLAQASNGNRITTIEKHDYTDQQLAKPLLDEMAKQVSELQIMHAIPQFKLVGQGKIYELDKVKISSKTDEYPWLELWNISADYDGVTISVLMDAETYCVFSIYARSDSAMGDWSAIQLSTYANYLGFGDSQISHDEKDIVDNRQVCVFRYYQLFLDDFSVTYSVTSEKLYFQYFLIDAKELSS